MFKKEQFMPPFKTVGDGGLIGGLINYDDFLYGLPYNPVATTSQQGVSSYGIRTAASQAQCNTANAAHYISGAFQPSTIADLQAFYAQSTASQQQPVENAGVKFGEIIAYRMWFLRHDFLTSYSAKRVWAPGETMKGKPLDYNEAGSWAFKDASKAIEKMLTSAKEPFPAFLNNFSGPGGIAVYGSVQLWGTVIEHELGYRAEFAQIKTLDGIAGIDNLHEREEIFHKLQQRYFVNSKGATDQC